MSCLIPYINCSYIREYISKSEQIYTKFIVFNTTSKEKSTSKFNEDRRTNTWFVRLKYLICGDIICTIFETESATPKENVSTM